MDERLEEVARDIAAHRYMTIDEARKVVVVAMGDSAAFRSMFERFAQDLAAWLASLPCRDPFASRRVATVYSSRSLA